MAGAAGAGWRVTVIGPGPLGRWLKTYGALTGVGGWDFVSNDRLRAGKEWVGCGAAEVLRGTAAAGLRVSASPAQEAPGPAYRSPTGYRPARNQLSRWRSMGM